jgi:hypothetical protein
MYSKSSYKFQKLSTYSNSCTFHSCAFLFALSQDHIIVTFVSGTYITGVPDSPAMASGWLLWPSHLPGCYLCHLCAVHMVVSGLIYWRFLIGVH